MSNRLMKSVMAGALALSLMAATVPSAFASHMDDVCTCTTRMSLAKPSLSFSGGSLQFIPRVDVDIRLRGNQNGDRHTVSVQYNGSSSYESEDVGVPGGTSFSGEKTILTNMPCEGRWRLKGIELGRISLSGITQSLVGDDQELNGTVGLHAAIAGCGFDEENRQFSFRLREFGNLRIGGWRSVR